VNFLGSAGGRAGHPEIAACVSDSYNLFHVIENVWCGELHDMIKASGGKLVARPDSGDLASVNIQCLQIMDRKVGMRTNLRGYKVLPSYLGLIQGDGINDESIGDDSSCSTGSQVLGVEHCFRDGRQLAPTTRSRHAAVRLQMRRCLARRRLGRRLEAARHRQR
jgi:hypothetical protein